MAVTAATSASRADWASSDSRFSHCLTETLVKLQLEKRSYLGTM